MYTSDSVYNDHLHKLYQQIYQPFKVYIKQYGQLELKYLQNKFENNIKMVQTCPRFTAFERLTDLF